MFFSSLIICYMASMSLDKSQHYTFRIGSDNQHRLCWEKNAWHYEFLAGSVLFDEQYYPSDKDLLDGLAAHGLNIERFSVDSDQSGVAYSLAIQQKMAQLKTLGIDPCPKHGLSSKNLDGSCEACCHADFPDDFKGTEG